ncbi:phosphate starvation-inducible protein PhoH [Ezakiella coagulans]|uniref:PhoH-like protein n=1 Tax=Ezakiella coagulans TaxID=46507 RepID=A0A2U1E2X9_9FIRM|nr:PhoH family protein [Ezakiella coagulans]PVY94059.1 phosphate starvation-inducible protein PhoH [Ezakiella coagulans]
MTEFVVKDMLTVKNIVGQLDQNINLIMEKLDVKISISDDTFKIDGENSEIAKNVLMVLSKKSKSGDVDLNDISYIIDLAREHRENEVLNLNDKPIAFTANGRSLFPKTIGQKRYIESINNNDIVFGTGPAGTGKTYLAIALACQAFRNKQFERIILTRPAVEAGESLGFLPGDLKEKVDPYLRPVYDALFEIIGGEQYQKYIEKGLIEIAPLAYMRGRTLDKSFIILDEAQNTTPEQMKMFLTRLGYSSKMVITGDLTQTDLPRGKMSGLKNAIELLRRTKGIGIEELQKVDIVRHPLVRKVIEVYEQEALRLEKIREDKKKEKENKNEE